MDIRQLHAANQGLAFVQSVAVRSARDEQVVLLGQGHVAFTRSGAVFAMVTLNPIQPFRDQLRDQLVMPVQPRVRQHGDPASFVN